MKLMDANEINNNFFNGNESYQTILSMARSKQIPACRIGKRIFFDAETLEQFFTQKMLESIKTEIVAESNGIHRID